LIIILTRRAAQNVAQIDGILWTTKRKKLIDPDLVTHVQRLKSEREIFRISQRRIPNQCVEPKMAIDVLGCMTLPNTLGSLFGYICFFG
jgi:hypothetical protein